MKKVICLYRVSTKSQVDYIDSKGRFEEDIPVQRIACHQFCEEKEWTIIKEFQEAAISAYFTPTFGREAIREIMAAARNHEFDVLLVFTLDRLSRRDYEFPMLIEQMTENGIAVWSVKDGECSNRTSTERLLVYLAGWRASCESERLGERVKVAQSQMVARGEYRGGPVPFGYCLIETEQMNRNGHHKHAYQIHEEEAEIVRMIFDKIMNEGYTLYALSKFLQSYPFPGNVRKQEWRKTTLQSMLKNPMYIGCLKFNDEISPPFKQLQIINPDLFQNVQAVVHRRASKPKANRQYPLVEDAPIYHDLLYCGHCGAPLVFTHAFQQHRNGLISIRYYYRCYGKERFVKPCDGACCYSAVFIDTKVRAYIDMIATLVLQGDASAMISNAVESERANHIVKLNDIRVQCEAIQKRVAIAQESISESLRQYGIAATTQLQLYYRDLCAKQSVLEAELAKLSSIRFRPDRMLKEKTAAFIRLKAHCAEYMAESIQRAEHWISRFVNKISVSKNYQLHFDLVPEIGQFVSIVNGTWLPTLTGLNEEYVTFAIAPLSETSQGHNI